MDPLYHNVLVMLMQAVYINGAVALCDWAVKHRLIPILLSRKLLLICATCNCFFWPLFQIDHWSWRLNIGVPVVYAVRLIVKGLILADPNDLDVRTMSRTGRPIELCQGPLLFTLILIFVGLYEFKTATATYIMAAVGFGDGLAPVVGIYMPYGPYRINEVNKTLSGSTVVFFGTILSIFLFRIVLGVPETLLPYKVIGVALVAALVSGKWDNPAIVSAIWWFLRATASFKYE